MINAFQPITKDNIHYWCLEDWTKDDSSCLPYLDDAYQKISTVEFSKPLEMKLRNGGKGSEFFKILSRKIC